MAPDDSPSTPAVDIASLRRSYTRGGLASKDLPADPMDLFETWFSAARDAGVGESNAMVLSTSGAEGADARIVLLKGVDERGFRFFTNLESAKARAIAADPRVSLLFPWHDLERQVRVRGTAVQLPVEESEAYFATRPRDSQLGAWASQQSEPVADRGVLAIARSRAEARFPGTVPMPEFWGGFVVRPSEIEFWQGRVGRLHDRFRYRRTDDGWTTDRLAP